MVIDMEYWKKVLKRLFILLLSIVGIFFAFKFSIFYMPFLIAFIISLLIDPIIKYICKRTNITRKISAIIVVVVIFVIIISLIIFGIVSIISETTNFLQSANSTFEQMYIIIQNLLSKIKNLELKIPEQVFSILQNSLDGFISKFTTGITTFLSNALQGVTLLPKIGIYIVITILATYFVSTDKFYIIDQIEHHLPKLWAKKLFLHIRNITIALGSYLKAEAILIFISFIEVLIGLYLFKVLDFGVEFPLLMALLIGFVDALPILGSGTVILPWACYSAVEGNLNLGIGLFVLYVIILIVRQIIEPKIVSSQIGIHPFFTLIAMFTGFKFAGIIGLLIGPIILIIIKNIYGTLFENGLVKSILNRK